MKQGTWMNNPNLMNRDFVYLIQFYYYKDFTRSQLLGVLDSPTTTQSDSQR